MRLMFFSLLFMCSCSANWHLNKAIKKGAEIQTVSDTVIYLDTLINGVIIKDTMYSVKNVIKYVPKTRYEIRFDNKHFRDSLKYIRLMYKDSVKTVVKTEKIQGKTEVKIQRVKSRWYLWLIIGFVLAHLLRYLSYIIGAFRNFTNGRL